MLIFPGNEIKIACKIIIIFIDLLLYVGVKIETKLQSRVSVFPLANEFSLPILNVNFALKYKQTIYYF